MQSTPRPPPPSAQVSNSTTEQSTAHVTVDDTAFYAPRSRAAAIRNSVAVASSSSSQPTTRQPNSANPSPSSSGPAQHRQSDSSLSHSPPTGHSLATVPVFYADYGKSRQPATDTPATADDDGEWRIRERMKTVSVALVVCMNVGVDPPDRVKTDPCAKLECWLDPFAQPAQKSLENIGKALQTQYEVWQPRARYKQALDPTAEDLKKLCCALRRNAKDERILLHYNGHGVPRPTPSGELWVFNKNYTQYIPVSIYDVQSWMGAPSLLVYDCSGAGNLMTAFNKFAAQRDSELSPNNNTSGSEPNPNGSLFVKNCIQLAACTAEQTLPMHPDLPADLFTSCLTTPIETALRWFVSQNQLLLKRGVSADMIAKLPGRLSDRRTPLGELNWIFTAITDTIAWNVLPRALFQRLFRQDLMVAALFRNFLLADRVLRAYHCTPLSTPPLPAMNNHPLWEAWDLAADTCLAQLPQMLSGSGDSAGKDGFEYQHSLFFAEQLTAFEVWLATGVHHHRRRPAAQLPIVLQVLLSQAHRLRALVLLGRFLDLGAWAVHQALAVGIFPYVLKLLQSPAVELKLILTFIWARIVAVDGECRADLLKDGGYMYFVNILMLGTANMANVPSVANLSELRAMCAFVLAVFAHGHPAGQAALLRANIMSACSSHLTDADPMLRQWSVICLGEVWNSNAGAQAAAITGCVHERIYVLLTDPVVRVRMAAMFALGRLLSSPPADSLTSPPPTEQHPEQMKANDAIIQLAAENICVTMLVCTADASPSVRHEFLIAMSALVAARQEMFVCAAHDYFEDEKQQTTKQINSRASGRLLSDNSNRNSSFYACMWKVLLNMSMDPDKATVAPLARNIVDIINYQMAATHRDLFEISSLTDNRHAMTLPANYLGGNSSLSGSSRLLAQQQMFTRSNSNSNNNNASSLSLTHASASKLSESLSLATAGSRLVRQSSLNRRGNNNLSGSSFGDSRSSSSGMLGRTSQRPASHIRPKSNTISAGSLNQIAQSNSGYGNSRPSSAVPVAGHRVDVSRLLPFQSTYYEQSLEFFKQPRLKPNDDDLPGGRTFVHKEWQRRRNSAVLLEAHRAQLQVASRRRPDSASSPAAGVIDSQMDMVTMLLFHPFNDHLVLVDNKNCIGVWNLEEQAHVTKFANGNMFGSRVSALKFINTHDGAYLFTGSDDGIVRLYRDYDDPTQRSVVTTWRSLSEILPDETSSGLVMDWQQQSGSLIVSGDVKHIRVWDAEKEMCTMEIPTRSSSCVTSLSSDQLAGSVVIAGCGDGAIRLYDRRCPPKSAMVMHFDEHKSWIVGVHLQTGSSRKLASGCADGEVKFWDSRFKSSVLSIEADPTGRVSSMALHDYAPLVAVGSESQFVKIYDCNGNLMSHIRHHDGFLGQRLAPVHCVAFHPHRVMMAAGGADQLVYTTTW